MNKEYVELLINRYKYFDSKPITELTNDEIEEFMNLKEEMIEIPEVRETIMRIWTEITETIHHLMHSPEFQAELLYSERVKKEGER